MKLINANEVIRQLGKWDISKLYLVEDFKTLIKEQPTADAVAVVRCEDCTLHNKCSTEDVFKFAGINNPFCCAGKKVE